MVVFETEAAVLTNSLANTCFHILIIPSKEVPRYQ